MFGANMDILTVTPNPSLDLLHEIDSVVWDDANRVDPPRRRPGGQGINVARAIRALGGSSHVLAPFGGRTGQELVAALEAERISFHATPIASETRIFSALRERSTGRSLLINPRGPRFSQEDVHAFADSIRTAIVQAKPAWVACCGSLPPGFPPSFYADVRAIAARAGTRFVADCDGEPLRQAHLAGCDLLVPNRYEAERLTGRVVQDPVSALAAARVLTGQGTSTVIVTLGADGAVIGSRGGLSAHASVAALTDGPAVGAGDSLLAGFIAALQRGASLLDSLADGVAAATSVLSGHGTDLMDMDAFRILRGRVRVTELT